MKKYLAEIGIVCFFIIANIGIIFYFNNEINSVKAEQQVAKAEAEAQAAKVKAEEEQAKKEAEEEVEREKAVAEAEAEKAKAEAAKADAEKAKAEAEKEAAKERAKAEKERKKQEKKERDELNGIHKYKIVHESYITWESANSNAINSGLGYKSYLLHLDSAEEWKVVQKKLNINYWYFIGGKYNYYYEDYRWVDGYSDDGYINFNLRFDKDERQLIGYEWEDYLKLQYIKRQNRWVWLDVTNANWGENEEPFQPEKGAYIIEYEE